MVSLFYFGNSAAASVGITEDVKLTNPEFWISVTKDADKVVLTGDQIKAFNLEITGKSPFIQDLQLIPDTNDGDALRLKVSDVSLLNNKLYRGGILFTDEEREDLKKELNLSVLSEVCSVRYGIAVRRTNLRTLPMEEGLFGSAEDVFFDNLQETAVDPSEPLIILHTSKSGKFFYVQIYNCRGWIVASDVAVTDRAKWLEYVHPDKFLTVTARNFFIPSEGEEILYQMGSRLLIKGKYINAFIVLIPRCRPDGTLLEEKQLIFSNNENVHEGFLPYTRANLIRQVFKFYGAPYGWGGLLKSEDCSGFVNDVYRVFGIFLPRNSGQQAKTAGRITLFEGLSSSQRYTLISENVSAGDVLCMKGHVMIYLGQSDGVHYAIHSLGSYTSHHVDGSKNKQRIMRVVVSDLSLKTWAGLEHIDAFTNSISYR
ncbi:MAG: hypothetical protein GXZ18_07490 [Synergistaceae bacterium]|nr:hypothetical protein [Synergistaceae bacterium]